MSKSRFAVAFAVLLGWCALAAAADLLEPLPLDRPLRGTREPLEFHDPFMHGESRMFDDLRPRPLPGEHEPLIGEPFLERPEPVEPRPYRENDPLSLEPPPTRAR